MAVITARNLVKHYGDVVAVNGITLSVPAGEVLALLGPNGAGKTTTVEILEGYRTATSGEVTVLGYDPSRGERSFKERIGIVLQESSVERELTVREALEVHGGSYPHHRAAAELIEIVGLEDKAEARVKTLSGGQKRRLEVALGIAGDPDLIFLDEPTTGFDPSARRQAWTVIDNLRSLGKTILLTTHYMDEAQHLADRVAVINEGVIVAEGTPEQIGGRDTAGTIVRFSVAGVAPTDIPIEGVSDTEGAFEFTTVAPTEHLHRLTAWAIDGGHELEGLSVSQPSLEEVYLKLTGDGGP